MPNTEVLECPSAQKLRLHQKQEVDGQIFTGLDRAFLINDIEVATAQLWVWSEDGTFARDAFAYDPEADIYLCPAGKVLALTGTLVNDGATLLYRASKRDCDICELKPRCCPKMPARKVPRSNYESARDVARGS